MSLHCIAFTFCFYFQPLERLEIVEPGDHRLLPNPSATSTPGMYYSFFFYKNILSFSFLYGWFTYILQYIRRFVIVSKLLIVVNHHYASTLPGHYQHANSPPSTILNHYGGSSPNKSPNIGRSSSTENMSPHHEKVGKISIVSVGIIFGTSVRAIF